MFYISSNELFSYNKPIKLYFCLDLIEEELVQLNNYFIL